MFFLLFIYFKSLLLIKFTLPFLNKLCTINFNQLKIFKPDFSIKFRGKHTLEIVFM